VRTLQEAGRGITLIQYTKEINMKNANQKPANIASRGTKNLMTKERASAIQSVTAKKNGVVEKNSFTSRAMSAGELNLQAGLIQPKKS
jgi:hypothetical protein